MPAPLIVNVKVRLDCPEGDLRAAALRAIRAGRDPRSAIRSRLVPGTGKQITVALDKA